MQLHSQRLACCGYYMQQRRRAALRVWAEWQRSKIRGLCHYGQLAGYVATKLRLTAA